ncbi:hypothetical protein D3C73_1195060 [compost metagenome]
MQNVLQSLTCVVHIFVAQDDFSVLAVTQLSPISIDTTLNQIVSKTFPGCNYTACGDFEVRVCIPICFWTEEVDRTEEHCIQVRIGLHEVQHVWEREFSSVYFCGLRCFQHVQEVWSVEDQPLREVVEVNAPQTANNQLSNVDEVLLKSIFRNQLTAHQEVTNLSWKITRSNQIKNTR